jgi:tRNA threonylcarbamoyladenosine biosynthesis protein TsaB
LLIKKCLGKAELTLGQIDALAVSRGPGSYTALRIGISVAKGIAYALDKPVVAVDTLQSLALASAAIAQEDGIYYPMIDARRMEVYTAPFDRFGVPLGEPRASVIDQDSFREEIRQGFRIFLSGNGAAKCKAVLPSEQVKDLRVFCDSAHLVPLARRAFEAADFVDIAYFTPFYLKPPNITIPKSKL